MKIFTGIIVTIIIVTIIIASGFIAYQDREIRFLVGTMVGVKPDPTSTSSELETIPMVTGLGRPTSIEFVGDDILLLEKETGNVRLIRNGELQPEILLNFNVFPEYESGLLGITSENSNVYFYLIEGNDDNSKPIAAHVYQYQWDGNNLVNETLVNTFDAWSQSHQGGTMIVTPENEVLLVRGDQRGGDITDKNWGLLQNHDNSIIDDTGVIIKIGLDETEKTPSKSTSPLDHYYALGIRNSFGLTVDPETNIVWMTENGPEDNDEINMVMPNFNSGWNQIMGPATSSQLVSLPEIPNFTYSDPEFTWVTPVAPTGIIFASSQWENEFSNSVFVGDCRGNLYNFKLNENRDGFQFKNPELQDNIANIEDNLDEIIIASDFKCISDLDIGPDGALYVVSHQDNGAIYKITPKN